MKRLLQFAICCLTILSFSSASVAQEGEEHMHASPRSETGLGRVHMDTSCSAAVAAKFDRALVLLHNFWYARIAGIPAGCEG